MPSETICFSPLLPLSSPVDRLEYIVNDTVIRFYGVKFARGPLNSYNSADIYRALKQNHEGKEHNFNASDARHGIVDLFQYLCRHSHEVLRAKDVNAGLIKLLARAGKTVSWMKGLEQHTIVQLVVAFSRARKEWKRQKASVIATASHKPATDGHTSTESGVKKTVLHDTASFRTVTDADKGNEKAATTISQGNKKKPRYHLSVLQDQLASKHIASFCDWMDENGVTESLESLPQFPPGFW